MHNLAEFFASRRISIIKKIISKPLLILKFILHFSIPANKKTRALPGLLLREIESFESGTSGYPNRLNAA